MHLASKKLFNPLLNLTEHVSGSWPFGSCIIRLIQDYPALAPVPFNVAARHLDSHCVDCHGCWQTVYTRARGLPTLMWRAGEAGTVARRANEQVSQPRNSLPDRLYSGCSSLCRSDRSHQAQRRHIIAFPLLVLDLRPLGGTSGTERGLSQSPGDTWLWRHARILQLYSLSNLKKEHSESNPWDTALQRQGLLKLMGYIIPDASH